MTVLLLMKMSQNHYLSSVVFCIIIIFFFFKNIEQIHDFYLADSTWAKKRLFFIFFTSCFFKASYISAIRPVFGIEIITEIIRLLRYVTL